MRLINPSSGGTVGPALAGITSVTSPAGQTLTLATATAGSGILLNTGVRTLTVNESGAVTTITSDTNVSLQLVASGSGQFQASSNGTAFYWTGSALYSGDNAQSFGLSTNRWSQGFFGNSGLRIGNGSQGANISATSDTAGNQSLVIRGATWSAFNSTFQQAVICESPIILDYQGTRVGNQAVMLNNSLGTLEINNADRFNRSGIKCGQVDAQGLVQGGYLSAYGGTASNSQNNSVQIGGKAATGILNATATQLLTITVPNGACGTIFRLSAVGALGTGGAKGAYEAVAGVSYDVVVARVAGSNAVATITASYVGGAANVSGATTATVTLTLGAVVGGAAVSNTIPVNITITRGAAGPDNHIGLVAWEARNIVQGSATIG